MLAFEKIHRFCYVTCILVLFHVVNSTENPYPMFIPYKAKEAEITAIAELGDIKDMGKEHPARWLTPDPHADQYPGWSPYNYVGKNPLLNIDPDGRDFYRHDSTGAVIWRKSTEETYIHSDGTVFNNIGDTWQYQVEGTYFVMFQTDEQGSLQLHTVQMFDNPTGMGIRNDEAGSGHFGASRSGGTRQHMGLDVLSDPAQDVVMPFTGELSVSGSGGVWARQITATGAEIDVYYVYTTNTMGRSPEVTRGSVVGIADNMKLRYQNSPAMKNHVHVRVDINRRTVNPEPFYFRTR